MDDDIVRRVRLEIDEGRKYESEGNINAAIRHYRFALDLSEDAPTLRLKISELMRIAMPTMQIEREPADWLGECNRLLHPHQREGVK